MDPPYTPFVTPLLKGDVRIAGPEKEKKDPPTHTLDFDFLTPICEAAREKFIFGKEEHLIFWEENGTLFGSLILSSNFHGIGSKGAKSTQRFEKRGSKRVRPK